MMAPPLLFLLIGQSNMAGRAPLDDQARTLAPGIRVAAADGQWRPAADPLHAEQINAALRCLAGRIPCYACVSSWGLTDEQGGAVKSEWLHPNPVWTPDGRSVIFHSDFGTRTPQTWAVDLPTV